MLRYETHKNEIEKIFRLINTGRFYSLTFVKKGDGQIRYLNGHRATYKKPDGSIETIRNVGYDPKNYNLIRVYDRNALNPKTGLRTGNYRSAALENIILIKCGNEVFDFIEENQIARRFSYVDLDDIRRKMKIEDIVDDEAQNMIKETLGLDLHESEELMGLPELAEMMSRMGFATEDALEVLQSIYYDEGDEGVKNFFKGATSVGIDNIGRGKYVFKY